MLPSFFAVSIEESPKAAKPRTFVTQAVPLFVTVTELSTLLIGSLSFQEVYKPEVTPLEVVVQEDSNPNTSDANNNFFMILILN